MSTLYREYRPQKFGDLVGQNHIKTTLEHEIETGKIAHAYIFCGPRGIGKTTVARVFAKALNCLNRKEGEHEPCDNCDSCRDIIAGRSLDIIEVDAASHTGVDNVRENIIAVSRIAPARYKFKVFIIDEVHMLSTPAFNALLKVLEEPPVNVIFVLCTTEIHKIPATIISRCQRFDFRKLGIVDMMKKLQFIVNKEKIKIDDKILNAIARQSEGHMRDAESLLGQVVSIGGKEITAEEADLVIPRSDVGEALRLIGFLTKKDAGRAIELINKSTEDGVQLKRFVVDLIELLRKMMLLKINPALAEKVGLEFGPAIEAQITQVLDTLDLERIIVFIEKFIAVKNDLRSSFIEQLPLEIAVIELCSVATVSGTVRQKSAPLPRPGGEAPGPLKGPEETKSGPAAADTGKLNKDTINAKWSEVLAKVKKYNHSLSFILRVCKPVSVNGRELCLAFKYKFHKDRVQEISIKQIIEKVLREVYESPLALEAIVDEKIEIGVIDNGGVPADLEPIKTETPAGTNDSADGGGQPNNMIENLLKTFGGRVIN